MSVVLGSFWYCRSFLEAFELEFLFSALYILTNLRSVNSNKTVIYFVAKPFYVNANHRN